MLNYFDFCKEFDLEVFNLETCAMYDNYKETYIYFENRKVGA